MTDVTHTTTAETYTIPVGPLHVALEEPMYFKIDVRGETIANVDINAGHVHRGIEYLTTKRTIYQNVILTERICSLCSNSHPETFAMAAEQIAGLEVPERALYLRVIAGEIKRIASNLFNIAILAHLVGYETLFMHVMEVREVAQDIKESVFGNRMDLGAVCIGGVRYDLDDETTAYLSGALDKLVPEIDEIIATYRTNGSILGRTRGIGILKREDALACGVVGPVARASGIDYDVRMVAPYAAYDRLPMVVHTLTDGDVWSRAMIRLAEARTAIELIRACLRDLPGGPTHLHDRPDIPRGQAVAKCEAPRGELIYYLKTNDNPEPERVKWRVPTFMNWDALRYMLADQKIADIAIIVNSIDPCVSCTER
ncbi:carbon monoxide-induced hydrogenase [Siculibacillus lacustris]|uniref:Carbon monoxide-induced hydrogenase n=1 Tax=Siculibacillus lacustris TaxID=1549641 RepID=A0A4Q9VM36_9HYPH|nr:nickel-dependent hydrogenase large subunit [Siculibacillus lacustris]TBW36626.1 carbon monoxide-induced hydrogenase [Siculibacillus lacustris]